MPVQPDCSIGIKKETVYGTAVTVDQHVEFLTESLKYTPTFYVGQGLRVGSRFTRKSRRAIAKVEAGGSLAMEATTRGLGTWLNAAFGTITNTPVPGDPTVYQQVHTPLGADFQNTYTIQKGVPLIGGAIQPTTFVGGQVAKIQFSCGGPGEPVKIETEWLFKTADTVTAYTTATYATGAEVLTFAHGSALTMDANGTGFTAPTTTALAIGTTAAANIKSFELEYDNGLSGDSDGGYTLGGGTARRRRAALGQGGIKGTLKAEYTDNTLRDAFMAGTTFALVLTFQHPTTIGTASNPVLQIVVTGVALEGDFPTANGGKPVELSCGFVGLDPEVSARAPIYVVYRTLDTAV